MAPISFYEAVWGVMFIRGRHNLMAAGISLFGSHGARLILSRSDDRRSHFAIEPSQFVGTSSEKFEKFRQGHQLTISPPQF
jgi:hypothetical protein